MKITLIVSYLFGILGVLLMIYRRFEPGFHSLSLGFIFGMVFSHSVVIFPSLLKGFPDENKLTYLPFIIFTIANVLRVGTGLVVYGGLASPKLAKAFAHTNIFSGFIHFFAIITLFLMIKRMTKQYSKVEV
jgi:hypothetical protein